MNPPLKVPQKRSCSIVEANGGKGYIDDPPKGPERTVSTQVDLGAFGARGLADAQNRASEYKHQLDEMLNARLKRRFLDHIAMFDPVARRLMK